MGNVGFFNVKKRHERYTKLVNWELLNMKNVQFFREQYFCVLRGIVPFKLFWRPAKKSYLDKWYIVEKVIEYRYGANFYLTRNGGVMAT